LTSEGASPVSLVVSDESDVLSAADAAVSGDLWGLQSTISVSELQAARRRRSSKRRRWAAALGAVTAAVVGIGSVQYVHRGGDGRAHAAAAAPAGRLARAASAAAPAAAPLAPEGNSVHVLIAATPPTASLYLDDAPLLRNPFEGDLPSDSARHAIRAEAPGYRSQTRVAELNQPVRLEMNLESASPASPPETLPSTRRFVAARGVSPAPAPVAAGNAMSQKAAALSCNNPYYFDDSGIKHVKPECLK
jgi:hypothetical protein